MFNFLKNTQTFQVLSGVMVLGALVFLPHSLLASDLSEHMNANSKTNTTTSTDESELSPGHRHIEGVVEEVQENTIRVDAGEAGEITPRYLNLDTNSNEAEFSKGDRLQIEVNAQNKVVKFNKIEAKSQSKEHH